MSLRGLSGKIAIVTGAAGGIGAATVRRLLEEGCKVAAVDLEKPTELRDGVLRVAADVSTEEGCERYVAATVERFGGADLFVNNAGVAGARKALIDMTAAEFDRTHAVNVRGVFLGLRAVIRQMLKQGRGGAIVNVASVGGLKSFPSSADYGSSKRAVIGLSGAAAVEYGKHGIRSNAFCPGATDTPMLRAALNLAAGTPQAAVTDLYKNQPLPRIGSPEEVAAFIAFLLSDEASYMTGGVYTADGGLTT